VLTVEASIHKIIAVDPRGRQDRDLNVNERWTYFVDQWDKKIELKMARVEATKMEAHATMFKAMNEGGVCLGFVELSTKISQQFETNGVLLNLALPKPKHRIGMRSEAPLDVLPAASHNIERIVFQPGHIVRIELQRYATAGQIDRESQARPNRFLI
jgi:hypothetical protein